MNILYITYWSADSPLSKSSAWPFLRAVLGMPEVDRVFYATIEREAEPVPFDAAIAHQKLKHLPLQVALKKPYAFWKALEPGRVRRALSESVKGLSVDLVVARCSPSALYAVPISQGLKVPLIMESFEPHAEDMVHSGVWKPGGLKYRLQRKAEKEALKRARFVYTVSNRYKERLTREGHDPSRISAMPCTVPMDAFAFKPEARKAVRQSLDIGAEAVVGIYAGKFGGLYYDEEAFVAYRSAFDHFGTDNFYLILLTAMSKAEVAERAEHAGIPMERIAVLFVDHAKVPDYLSAADFAFSMIRHNPSSPFCSPIKNGEYWACGLPIFSSDFGGDDIDVVQNEKAGVVVQADDVAAFRQAMQEMDALLQAPDIKQRMRRVAAAYRDESMIAEAYRKRFMGLV
jgi:glycosyltransferase involved in cell wall biosynthesis